MSDEERGLTLHTVDTMADLSLDDLAENINGGHEWLRSGLRRMGVHVVQVGGWLVAAKGKVKHGEWLPWLAEKCAEITDRTARRYVSLYEKAIQNRTLMSDLKPTEAYKMLGVIPGNVTTGDKHVSTGEVEWYTPVAIIESVRRVLGSIDTDPASCDAAQEIVQAKQYYTKETDGLEQQWTGSVFLNPPYAVPDINNFVDRAVAAIVRKECDQIIILTNNSSDTDWFQTLSLNCDLVCLTDGRVGFYNNHGETLAARQGQALFYAGKNAEGFIAEFKDRGVIFRKA